MIIIFYDNFASFKKSKLTYKLILIFWVQSRLNHLTKMVEILNKPKGIRQANPFWF